MIESLEQLGQYVHLDQLPIPDVVRSCACDMHASHVA